MIGDRLLSPSFDNVFHGLQSVGLGSALNSYLMLVYSMVALRSPGLTHALNNVVVVAPHWANSCTQQTVTMGSLTVMHLAAHWAPHWAYGCIL
jgi:hypothetical protein